MKEFEFLTKDIVDIKSVIDLNKIYANPLSLTTDRYGWTQIRADDDMSLT